MAVSISTKGATLHHDLNEAKLDGLAYLGTVGNHQRGLFINAIDACCAAMAVDENHTHTTSFTIAASVTNNSVSITIS